MVSSHLCLGGNDAINKVVNHPSFQKLDVAPRVPQKQSKGELCCCLRLTYLKVIIDYQVGN